MADLARISWDVPEAMSWETLSLIFGDEDGRLIAEIRRDLADRDRWNDDGGAVVPPPGQG